MSAVVWAHCVICKTLVRELNGVPLLITSCGRLVCQSCCPRWDYSWEYLNHQIARARDTSCPTCVGGCNTVEMNSKAPSNLQNLFKDVNPQMKAIAKTLQWQEAQKKSIVEHRVITISLIAVEI